MLATATRSPLTISTRLLRSVVDVTTASGWANPHAPSRQPRIKRAARAALVAIDSALHHFGSCHRLVGIKQCTFFSFSLTLPTRQPIAPLASPYASRRAMPLLDSSHLIMPIDAPSIALLRSASATWLT